MQEILKEVCKQESISASALSNKLGFSRGFVNSVTYRKEEQLLYKLLTLFPNLNPYFLIFGQGPINIDLTGGSNISKIARSTADYKVLYEQMKLMYEDVTKTNVHLNETIKRLLKQNEALIDANKALSINA